MSRFKLYSAIECVFCIFGITEGDTVWVNSELVLP